MNLNKPRIKSLKHSLIYSNKKTTINNLISRWNQVINKNYSCIVLDFDGTLRSITDRDGPINPTIISEIQRLGFDCETEIYIATGRRSTGIKVGKELTKKKGFKIKMILGNGSEVRTFPSNKIIYNTSNFKEFEISDIANCITKKCGFNEKCIFIGDNMIRIFFNNVNEAKEKVEYISSKIKSISSNFRVTYSGLNIEVVPKNASKENAIKRLKNKKVFHNILTIGDCGGLYGNDFGMLSNFNSFCVGEDSIECIDWTLPVIDNKGNFLYGPIATLYLLNRIC